MDATTTTTMTGTHPFEQAGLGKAPFRLAGFSESTYQACPGAPTQPGTSCDACGTAIRYVCRIRSSDGREFKVGTDCVMKLDRADNRLVSEVEAAKKKIERQKRQAKADARTAREKDQIAAAFARLDADDALRLRFAQRPHPSIPGHTMLDYVQWMRANAGHSGRLRIAKVVEAE
jgi:hypothetical protein